MPPSGRNRAVAVSGDGLAVDHCLGDGGVVGQTGDDGEIVRVAVRLDLGDAVGVEIGFVDDDECIHAEVAREFVDARQIVVSGVGRFGDQ